MVARTQPSRPVEFPAVHAVRRSNLRSARRGGAIFDEVQRAPRPLSWIQVVVDEQRGDGMFVLIGSRPLLFDPDSSGLEPQGLEALLDALDQEEQPGP